MNRKQISPKRKGIFYVGMALFVIGLISFGSVFLSAAFESLGIGRGSSGFHIHGIHGGSGFMEMRTAPARAFGGFALILVGQFLCSIGKMGLAGAGVVLDPEKARKDVEPWSRMGGGIIKDALSEADIRLGSHSLPFDEQLRRLHKLREDGIVSEAEYQAKKKRILESH